MAIDQALNVWMNIGVLFVVAGAACYASLWRYMD